MPDVVTYSRRIGYAFLMLSAVGCAGLGGESVRLHTSPTFEMMTRHEDTVFVVKEAKDRRHGDQSSIGKSTWTLFKVEHSKIKAEQLICTDLARIVARELEASGYPVELVDQRAGSDATTLQVSIDQFEFEMWSYFWPYVMIDGKIGLSLAIQSPEEEVIESRSFTSPGKSACWFGGCADKIEDAIDESLKAIGIQMSPWFRSEGFREIWEKVEASSPSEPEP